MSRTPTLFVIAGCNGSGKSTFSNAVIPPQLQSFDYDQHFLEIYNSQFDWELKEQMAHNMAREKLIESVDRSITSKQDFCYETNYNSTPLYWPNKFKKAGFNLELIYFCLSTTTEAKRRVQIRVENGGHFVPEKEIEMRFTQGYSNLNKSFHLYDFVHLLDSNKYGEALEHLLSFYNGEIAALSNFPKYLHTLLPSIFKVIQSNQSNL